MNRFAHERHEPAPVVVLRGSINADGLTELRDGVTAAIADHHGLVVIDLTAVTWVKTDMLSALCRTLRMLSEAGASLAIVGADPRVQWVVETCEIQRLKLHPTIDAAVTDSRAAGPAHSDRDIWRRGRATLTRAMRRRRIA